MQEDCSFQEQPWSSLATLCSGPEIAERPRAELSSQPERARDGTTVTIAQEGYYAASCVVVSGPGTPLEVNEKSKHCLCSITSKKINK